LAGRTFPAGRCARYLGGIPWPGSVARPNLILAGFGGNAPDLIRC